MALHLRLHRGSRLKWFLVVAVAVNLVVLVYLAFLQDSMHLGRHRSERDTQSHDPSAGANNCPSTNGSLAQTMQTGITVLVREFEEFQNDLAVTVKHFKENFPHALIVLLADKLPYPPIKVAESSSVRLVMQKAPPNVPMKETRVDSVVTSKYVLLVPDATKPVFGIDFPKYITRFLESQPSHVRLVAWPVDSEENVECTALNVKLEEWTLQYQSASGEGICDALQGKFVALIRTVDLFNLTSPFERPLHQSLFIQTALRGWKVAVDNKILFASTRQLYEDPHYHWKHKSTESQRLKTLHQRFGIKLVEQTDGQQEWYGCSKETQRCFGTVIHDMPEYIYNQRWTPPCCLQALRTTARHVFRVLESQGVRYWLEGGSLLGAARNGDIIPWDYDIDVGIYRSDITKSSHLLSSQTESFIDDDGFVWEKATEGDFIRVQYSQTNHLHVDIFPFVSRNGTMTKNHWMKGHRQDTEFPEQFLKPLRKISFVGTEAYAPNRYREFLELKFGKGVIENPKYPDGSKLTTKLKKKS